MFDISENLKKLPDSPGVYLHKDRLGNIIYVGKAISLRNRVRQYFRASSKLEPRIRSMVSQIAEFEYITTGSEMEALILECNLIKKHRPKYNILLRDDKTYPYIKVTNEDFPRIVKTRMVKKDGGRYFGPYSDAGAVNRIVDLLNSTFCLKRCSAAGFPRDFRPCLNFHIKECRGICTGEITKAEYNRALEGAVEFLRGHTGPILKELKEKMMAASEAMEYEEAASFRDSIEAVNALSETQRVVLRSGEEADVVLPCITDSADGRRAYIAVFTVRDGKLVGRETYEIGAKAEQTEESKGEKAELVQEFIKQHYGNVPNVPKEILVAHMPVEGELLEEFISSQAGHKVRIIKPERGEKRALIQMASKDVVEMVKTIDERAGAAREREDSLSAEIWNVLSQMGKASGPWEKGRKFRVEAYDISNTNGVDTVGGMVVFDGLKAHKSSYRKFKIKNVQGQDDYASMREVLCRRFLRVFKEAVSDEDSDSGFSVLPDLILMDGGRGHVGVAMEVVSAAGFDIPVIGMVKDNKHRTRALVYRESEYKYNDGDRSGNESYSFKEISLRDKPMLFKYIGRIQEEVHRFAIEYHRKLRSKSVQKSILDQIPGIGQVRRRALLEAFGSVEEIKKIAQGNAEAVDASDRGSHMDAVSRLAQVPGMDRRAAKKVVEFFLLRKNP